MNLNWSQTKTRRDDDYVCCEVPVTLPAPGIPDYAKRAMVIMTNYSKQAKLCYLDEYDRPHYIDHAFTQNEIEKLERMMSSL